MHVNIAPYSARLAYLESVVQPVELVALLLETQENALTAYGLESILNKCYHRTATHNIKGEFLATICQCPAGVQQFGIGCTKQVTECAIAQRWHNEMIRMDVVNDRERTRWEKSLAERS